MSENEGFTYLPSEEFTGFDELLTIFMNMKDNNDNENDINSENYLTAIIYPCDKTGQINCHGETVAGFTTDYVVNGESVRKVRDSIGDTWHVTAKMSMIIMELLGMNCGILMTAIIMAG